MEVGVVNFVCMELLDWANTSKVSRIMDLESKEQEDVK